MSEFEVLFTKLMKAVSYSFKEDATRPGVVFSVLRDGSFYASVVRYGNQFPRGKEVVCKAQASDPTMALKGLSVIFLDTIRKEVNPIVDLMNEVTLQG